MSADSPRRGLHKGAQVVSPQPISDKSIIDSVAGIINDIVPQAYTGIPSSIENKESISWARFEYADINDPTFYPDFNEGSSIPPLLLVLGYTTGVQVWLVAASGEATEVLSWRQGVVRTLRILPNVKITDGREDPYKLKRPLVAICDSNGPGPQFCNVSFISLKTGELIKSIKFKTPVCDILANKRSIVVTFGERIAVFDAKTLEDVLTITTCYPSPGPNPNPVALGTRWLAYSEKKLVQSRRSSGGRNAEGVQSYTATVLYAAKSLGKGLKGLSETVASSLTGNSASSSLAVNNSGADMSEAGVVTILDLQAAKEEKIQDDSNIETVVAHFTAHIDPIVAMTFDSTGALLMTADKRGHDFYIFRIHPHPGGPTLAAVHHLYTLHRGDTTAKVQDMVFSTDARWAAISTVRGTTHVFPVAPYGGATGMRTHSTAHVVNRLSRFHRSAGLTDDAMKSNSPHFPLIDQASTPFQNINPRLPPYPVPTTVTPLAQIRQPSVLSHVNNQPQQRIQQRQRIQAEENLNFTLKICACFAAPRAWIHLQRDAQLKVTKKAVESLFIMACHGNLIQYDLDVKPLCGVPKEKICDDTPIELDVEAKGQWPLLRAVGSMEIMSPLQSSNPLLSFTKSKNLDQQNNKNDGQWLSQVEIFTHAGPHRRLWMGPQFSFKTYNAPSGMAANLIDAETVEISVNSGSRPARSNPVNMPHAANKPLVPLVIDGSGSSYEQSPRFVDAYSDALDHESIGVIGCGESQLKEDLAEAMLETSSVPLRIDGRPLIIERVGQPVNRVVNPLGTEITVSAVEEDTCSPIEFDLSIESTPEPPRSVCAEEGPASLGDLEVTEPLSLREHTEICAEMCSATEPAIDNVPDENIKDLKENKTLCAEVAVSKRSNDHLTVDFDKTEAFSEVPANINLCAEKGAVPDTSMTQAKEASWKESRNLSKEECMQEKIGDNDEYIVSHDEEKAVIVEPKVSDLISSKKLMNKQGMDKKNNSNISAGAIKKTPKNFGKEQKEKVHSKRKSKRESNLEKRSQKDLTLMPPDESPVFNESPNDQNISKSSLPSETKMDNDLKSLEFQVVEKENIALGPENFISSSAQSDDDLEHICSSDIALTVPEKTVENNCIPDLTRKPVLCFDDDDLEHINTSEFRELITEEKNKPLSSDDEMEHITHSDIQLDKLDEKQEDLANNIEDNQENALQSQKNNSKKIKIRSNNQQSSLETKIEIVDHDKESKIIKSEDQIKHNELVLPEVVKSDINQCKVYETNSDQISIRKKSKRHRKTQQVETPLGDETPVNDSQVVNEVAASGDKPSVNSWKSMMRRRSSVKSDNEDTMKIGLEPLLEIGDTDDNKENMECENDAAEAVLMVDNVKKEDMVVDDLKEKGSIIQDVDRNNDLEVKSLEPKVVPMEIGEEKRIVSNDVAPLCLTAQVPTNKINNRWKKKKRR